jgi:hypothetical protein
MDTFSERAKNATINSPRWALSALNQKDRKLSMQSPGRPGRPCK